MTAAANGTATALSDAAAAAAAAEAAGAPRLHFVVEATWVGGAEEGLGALDQAHTALAAAAAGRGVRAVLRPWLASTGPWSVPSYDAVWGAVHAYAGASVTVGAAGEASALLAVLGVFRAYAVGPDRGGASANGTAQAAAGGQAGRRDGEEGSADTGPAAAAQCGEGGGDRQTCSTAAPDAPADIAPSPPTPHRHRHRQPCSDCVTVLHRVGDGLRAHARASNGSFNPALASAALWVEIDCGHFHRQRATWPTCRCVSAPITAPIKLLSWPLSKPL